MWFYRNELTYYILSIDSVWEEQFTSFDWIKGLVQNSKNVDEYDRHLQKTGKENNWKVTIIIKMRMTNLPGGCSFSFYNFFY